MAGTNDILRSDDAATVIEDLNRLIDRLQEELPDVPILVSSIAPIDPAFRGELRASIVEEVNLKLPELAQQHGSQVTYVNGGGSLNLDDLVADGIHPDAAGYQKIGNAWYDSIIEQDTLTGIDHIQGTVYGDRLTGNEKVNILFGNGGADTLSGGEGADTFVYENLDAEIDTITDFDLSDRLVFFASGFDGDLVAGANLIEVDSETKVVVNTTNPYSLGTGASFDYETETGLLSFDPDGSGSIVASEIAILSNTPSLSGEQITIAT